MLLNFDPSFVSTCVLPDHISRFATSASAADDNLAAAADHEQALQLPFKHVAARY